LQAEEKFKKLSTLNVVINALRLALLGGLYAAGALTTGTAIMTVILSSFVIASIVFLTEHGYRPVRAFRESMGDFRDLFFWGRWLSLMAIANILYVRLDVILLGYFHIERSAIGNYALAYAFSGAIVAFQPAMMTLLVPKVSAIDTPDRLRSYIKRAALVSALAVPALLLFGVSVDFFLGWFYGGQYPYAAGVFPLLAGGFAVTLLATPFSALSMTIDRPQILAYQNILGFLTVLLLGLIMIPRLGIYGCAVSVFSSRLLMEAAGVLGVYVILRRKGGLMHLPGARP
jgi:O-antigen/teichoic acid export membrane protein